MVFDEAKLAAVLEQGLLDRGRDHFDPVLEHRPGVVLQRTGKDDGICPSLLKRSGKRRRWVNAEELRGSSNTGALILGTLRA